MVTEHQVRERAYHIWEIEGRVSGRAEHHWQQAEADLRASTPTTSTTEADSVTAASSTKSAKKVTKVAKAAKPKVSKTKTGLGAGAGQVALHS